jgi:acyl-CoA synthetase (AMP-forming)/AMP-acid ligase II
MALEDQFESQQRTASLLPPGGSSETLADLLRLQVRRYPGEPACVVLNRQGQETSRITYDELDRRATAVAAVMQLRAEPGDRALLAFPTGSDFLVAFYACAYARMVAVPVPAPGEGAANGTARLTGIIEDAVPGLVLTTTEIAARPEEYGLGATPALAVATVPDARADQFRAPGREHDVVPAFMQYTSGSTSEPKGVQISHRNVLANLVGLETTIPLSLEDGDRLRIASWLPLFHDMGLAQAVLPVASGGMVVLISPTSFLFHPVLWLEAITRYRAHMATAPNFAYDLCAHRVTEEQRSSLDLTSWRFALNGSEHVRAGTLDSFARTFAPAGFSAEAYVPCYGLAESTFYISGARGVAGHLTVSVPALEQESLVRAPEGDEAARRVVSCGPVASGVDIRIVDPVSHQECLPGRVGEIWATGDSISHGYWRRTDERFGARIDGAPGGPFLRTSDLGFLLGGELYVLGRLDDVIVLYGRNHYPHEIELTVQQSHPAVAAGRVAAFGYQRGEDTVVVVAAETARRVRVAAAGQAPNSGQVAGPEVVQAVRSAVAAEHNIQVAQVVLLRPAGLPMTTSGKVRRRRCRDLFLADGLKTW